MPPSSPIPFLDGLVASTEIRRKRKKDCHFGNVKSAVDRKGCEIPVDANDGVSVSHCLKFGVNVGLEIFPSGLKGRERMNQILSFIASKNALVEPDVKVYGLSLKAIQPVPIE